MNASDRVEILIQTTNTCKQFNHAYNLIKNSSVDGIRSECYIFFKKFISLHQTTKNVYDNKM